jgi:sugar lactone lactonase YvrE
MMPGSVGVERNRLSRAYALVASSALFLLFIGASSASRGQAPGVVFSQANGVTGIGSTAGAGDFGGTSAHSSANSRGDVFLNVSTSKSEYVDEIPANGGAQVALLTDSNAPAYGGRSVFVDSSSNLYVTVVDGTTYSANIVYIPFINGTYPTGAVYSTLTNCSAFPVPATTTAACNVPLNYPASLGYYAQTADVALDGGGNLYVLAKYIGGSPATQYNMVIEWPAKTNNATILAGTLPNNTGNPEFAVDKAGDVFYEDGSGNNYYLAAGSSTLISMPLYYIGGVSIDAGQNVYFTQANGSSYSIIELPFINGTACNGANCTADQYTLTTQLGTGYTSGPSNGLAITGYGKIYYSGSYPNSLSSLTVGNLSFGSTNVGSTSGTSTLTVFAAGYIQFNKFKVSGPFAVSSTTCTTNTVYGPYQNNTYCAVTVSYTATAPGPQTGSIQAYDIYGNLLGEAILSGAGVGSTVNVDPGTVSPLGSGFAKPVAIAVDASGNTYVADTGSIYKTVAGGSSSTAVATGFGTPTSIAVDGAGNLYVGDAHTGQIIEVPYANGAYGTQKALVTGLRGTSGLTLDNNGNLYVADSGNGRVLLLSGTGNLGDGSIVSTIATGFTTPIAVAIDASSNLYVSDSGTGKVTQIATLTGTQATILSGLTTASGIAVDAGGSLFVVDSGAGTILHIPNIGGVLNKNFAVELGTIVTSPNAIAVDSSGNVYVTGTNTSTATPPVIKAAVASMNRSTGLLQFGNEEQTYLSASTAATVSDGGTAALLFNSPYFSATGSTSSYALQSSSTCANSLTLAPGAACSVSAVFTPASSGVYTETVSFSSTPSTTSTLILAGTGVNLPKTTTTISSVTPAAPTYGQTVTVAATVAPVTAGTQPAGTVAFTVDGIPQAQTSTVSSGGAVSIILSSLSGGAHTIVASYSGSTTYAPSTSAIFNLSIGKSGTTSTATILSSTVYSNPTSQMPGVTVTFNAVVTPSLPGTPTGTVNFYNGATLLGSVALTANSTASFSTSTLAVGQYAVSSAYSGDANYNGSTSSGTQSLLISNPTIQVTPSATSIVGGGPAVTFTITSVAGFGLVSGTTGAIDLACGKLPAYAICSFSPPVAQVSPTTSAQIALTILINQPPVIAVPAGIGAVSSRSGWFGILLSLLFLLPVALAGFSIRRRHRGRFGGLLAKSRYIVTLLFLLGVCTAAFTGCGNSSTSTYTTPKGTSALLVNATISAGAVNPAPAQTVSLQLIVN